MRFATAAPSASFAAENVTLSLLGQTLTGNVSFGRITSGPNTGSLSVTASGIGLSLGGGAVRVQDAGGTLLMTPTGLAGDLGGSVALNIPQVSAGGSFRIRLNTTALAVNDPGLGLSLPGGPYVQVSGTGGDLDVLGQRLSGDFAIERTTTQAASRCCGLAWPTEA